MEQLWPAIRRKIHSKVSGLVKSNSLRQANQPSIQPSMHVPPLLFTAARAKDSSAAIWNSRSSHSEHDQHTRQSRELPRWRYLAKFPK